MSEPGYTRHPAIHGDTVVFVCEDDLWTVSAAGGIARRLTSNPGKASLPALSPDGELLAFIGRDEGHPEVYVMPAMGGPASRLTYLGAETRTVGWTPDGSRIVFASNTAQPLAGQFGLYTVDPEGSEPEFLDTGPAVSVSFGPSGGRVIGRNTTDLARWKRYRGGLTGDLWLDPGDGDWRRLIELEGNVALPLWVGERVFFVSDHEGIGNLYSCRPTGDDLQRHTDHDAYYVRQPATDGVRIVYQAGADLHVYDPATGGHRIEVALHSPRARRKRKFVSAGRYLQAYDAHPKGHSVAVTTRGKSFTMANWEGAVTQHGEAGGVRHRLTTWLADGERLVTVSDASGEEALEVHAADASAAPRRLDLDVGRPVSLRVAPRGDFVAVANHRNELVLVDLEAETARVLDRSRHARLAGMAWSPDGQWVAYGLPNTAQTTIVKLCRIEDGATFDATRPVLHDVAPAFDPGGRYLYFLSYRVFDPVYDNLHFDLGFPQGMRPHLITLQADLPSPFVPVPRAPGDPPPKDGEDDGGDEKGEGAKGEAVDKDAASPAEDDGEAADAEGAGGEGADEKAKEEKVEPVQIDLEGLAERVIAFPVPEGRYRQILGIKGKALFTVFPVEGALGQSWADDGPPPGGRLVAYDFAEQEATTLTDGVGGFTLSLDGKTMVYQSGFSLRAVKAGAKAPKDGGSGRKGGWLDLGRVRVSVDPHAEWSQMYREAWRLQRDQFWTADMSGVDWQAVYQRYLPLVERVATRSEFSDLMWEMQGELGTSHAYEFGGDYPPDPAYSQGFLGADLARDAEGDGYVVRRIVAGDVWDQAASSPLARPGVDVRVGDRLVAVAGRPVGPEASPAELLVNQAGNEVCLTFAGREAGDEPRSVTVKTLRSETAARYRAWVEGNRRCVHEATDGRVGYVHIPDMGPRGYAEFHRGFLAEVDRDALIVDARFNGGGHVSQLILEKLARRRLGYDVQRWGEPLPYPTESVRGPMVALANEQAGSDGDMFSHAFKMMGLGPLIGTRTWGGVIGIHVRDSLVDGGFTSQPEFSFWFEDVGWGLENYGTEPDIPVEIRPQDHVAGRDTQLERGIAEIERLLEESPPALPDFGDRPRLELPKLPKAEQ